MKEDADELSRAIPDAQETQNPSLPHTERGPGARSASSASHVVEGYDELVQFSLLVNNSTDMLDIQEARLTFNRCCLLPTLESGMPTLRRFIRATDWHRIEAMIRNVAELPAEDKHAQCYFRHPMLFRIPGESRSYLRSHDTFVTLADTAIVPGTPTRFWVCFSCFDESQFRRPRLQDLDEIPEERVETGEHFQEVLEGPRLETTTEVTRARGRATKDGQVGWVLFKDPSGRCFFELQDLLLCRGSVALTDNFDIGACKAIRKLEVGETLQSLEEPRQDESRSLTRIKVRALSDGKEGWATSQGNQGTLYVVETNKHFTCAESVDLEASPGKALRRLEVGEGFELLQDPTVELRQGKSFARGRCSSSDQSGEGWFEISEKVQPWTHREEELPPPVVQS